MPYFVIPARISKAMLRILESRSLDFCVSIFCIISAASSRYRANIMLEGMRYWKMVASVHFVSRGPCHCWWESGNLPSDGRKVERTIPVWMTGFPMPLFEVVSVALSVWPFIVYPLGAMWPMNVSHG